MQRSTGLLGLVLAALWLCVVPSSAGARPLACGPAWTVVASPNVGSAQNVVQGVDAASTADAWAVGWHLDAGTGSARTTSLRWLGTDWSIVPTPNRGTNGNVLADVDAVSSDDAWTVGTWSSANERERPLAQHWNGSSWSLVDVRDVGVHRYNDTFLSAVDLVGTAEGWAVGSFTNGGAGPPRTIAFRWRGGHWRNVATPNANGLPNALIDVSTLSATDAWAVGHFQDETDAFRTLALHWNGSIWSVVPTPNVGPDENHLVGVDAVAADDVWAVGSAGLDPLVLHWNGSGWTVVPAPNPGFVGDLRGVSAVASGDVWAVGAVVKTTRLETLVEHWNGTSWAAVPSPNRGSSDNELNAVTALAGHQWAVGDSFDPTGSQRTLVEERCPARIA